MDYPKLCPLCGHPYMLHAFYRSKIDSISDDDCEWYEWYIEDWCSYCESVLAEDDLGTPICETPSQEYKKECSP